MSDDDLIRRGDVLAVIDEYVGWGDETISRIRDMPAVTVGVKPTDADREWIDARAAELFRQSERDRGAVVLNTIRPQDYIDYFVVDATLERFAALAPQPAPDP